MNQAAAPGAHPQEHRRLARRAFLAPGAPGLLPAADNPHICSGNP